MGKFSDAAKATKNNSMVTLNRTKIDGKELFGKIITINECDLLKDENGKDFAVCAYQEDPNKFFFGGVQLTNIVKAWLNMYGGDVVACNADLKNEPVKIQMSEGKTKKGKTMTVVEVID